MVAASSVGSLPPCGGGSGEGGREFNNGYACISGPPPPTPPHKGEGSTARALHVCASTPASSAREAAPAMNVLSTPVVLEEGEQASLLAAIDRWLEREVKPVVKEHDHADRWPAKIVAQMQELGLFGATVGTAYGGLGLPATHLCGNRHAHFRGLDGDHRHLQLPPDAGACHRKVRHRAAEAATGCRKLASGEMRGGLALTEPDAGTDLQAHPHDGAARGRPLCDQRHQDLDLQRHRRLLLRAPGEDRSRGRAAPQGHEPVHRAEAGRASGSAASSRSSATRRSIRPS